MQKLKKIVLIASISLLGAACSDSGVETADTSQNTPTTVSAVDGARSIVQTAMEAGTFNTLMTALQTTGLDAVLGDETREFTVFAPTDEAFDKLGQDTIAALLNDTETLSNILLYHVIADSNVSASEAIALDGQSVSMANGDKTNISYDGLRLFVNTSEVTVTDINTSNGVIHVIDTVLSPPPASPTADDASTPGLNLVETAQAAGDFSTLVSLLELTGLDNVLSDSTRSFTVFAPTNAAFDALGAETLNQLANDTETLSDILLYHVLADISVDANTALSLAGSTVDAANGDPLALSLNQGKLFINRSEVIQTDIQTANGIIHVIDTVLTPPSDVEETPALSIVDTAIAAGSFNTLVTALQVTGLDTTLNNLADNFTVFAPSDDAFAKLGQDAINALLADPDALRNVLLYHVLGGQIVDSTTAISLAGNTVATSNGDTIAISLDGNNLLINQSTVITADVRASNGIIHVIDTVLIPPSGAENTPEPTDQTLLEIARNNGSFNLLTAALEATGLDGAIGHSGDLYTVFAPTDEAFNRLGQETINALLNDPATLRDILLYHVIAGTVVDAMTATSLVGTSIQAGNGDRFLLSERDGSLFINESKIIATDIRGVNGIIHVIDEVLIPPAHQ